MLGKEKMSNAGWRETDGSKKGQYKVKKNIAFCSRSKISYLSYFLSHFIIRSVVEFHFNKRVDDVINPT